MRRLSKCVAASSGSQREVDGADGRVEEAPRLVVAAVGDGDRDERVALHRALR
jgi:hypothetical protein